MTGTVTALGPTIKQRWFRWRWFVAVVGVMLAGAIVLAIAQSQQSRGYLEPEGVDPGGSRALVRILEDQGVDVTAATTMSDVLTSTEPNTTVVVTHPDLLTPEQIDELKGVGADLVLIEPGPTVSEFDAGISVSGAAGSVELDAECELPAARLAGSAQVGRTLYDAPTSAVRCYPDDDAAALVVNAVPGVGTLVVLGAADPLTNRHLGETGNAALAMSLLGANGSLTWYRPTLEAGVGGDTAITDLMPGWVEPVAWQLVIAAALAAMWRARRFGPLVAEPLPVVVRATEVTEGRAGLYRRGHARPNAADSLREATITRLRTAAGLPASASSEAVVNTLAARTGRNSAELHELLLGKPPRNDSDLVRLAGDLSALEDSIAKRSVPSTP